MRVSVSFESNNNIWNLKTDEPEAFERCNKCRKELEGYQRGYFCKQTKKMWCKDCEMGTIETHPIQCGVYEEEHTHYCISSINQFKGNTNNLLAMLILFVYGTFIKFKGII